MILNIPKLNSEDSKQFKRIFTEISNHFQKEIDSITNRSIWKKIWNSKQTELFYYIAVKTTVDVLMELFNENINTIKINESN